MARLIARKCDLDTNLIRLHSLSLSLFLSLSSNARRNGKLRTKAQVRISSAVERTARGLKDERWRRNDSTLFLYEFFNRSYTACREGFTGVH